MNLREKYIRSCSNELVSNGYDPCDIQAIMNIMMTNLDKYELSERVTDIGFVDNSTEALIKLYLGTMLSEGKSEKTIDAYRYIIKKFYNDVGKPLLEVNVFDIRVWLAKLQGSISLRTCENYRSYISSFYHWLELEEIIPKSPAAKIGPIKYNEDVKLPFSPVEMDIIRGNCESLRERAIIEMLVSSGMRVSEMCALNIDDLNYRTKSIHIKHGKGNKERIVFIDDVCLRHLQNYLFNRQDKNDAMFLNRFGNRMSKHAVEEGMRNLGKRTNIKDLHPHRFRRTFATNMMLKGMDINVIQKLLGHTNISTTMLYIHTSETQIKSEYEKYN